MYMYLFALFALGGLRHCSSQNVVNTIFLYDEFSKGYDFDVVKACLRFSENFFANNQDFQGLTLSVKLVDFPSSLQNEVR